MSSDSEMYSAHQKYLKSLLIVTSSLLKMGDFHKRCTWYILHDYKDTFIIACVVKDWHIHNLLWGGTQDYFW